MKIDKFWGNSNCEKSMKARTNLRPSMESLMPGLQFEKKLSKLVEIWFTSDENAMANFFLGHPVLLMTSHLFSATWKIWGRSKTSAQHHDYATQQANW